MAEIHRRSGGDFMTAVGLVKRMAEAIEQPGKAQARGYAAQNYFGQLSPLAYIFFERAQELGGDNVKPEASVDPIKDVESAYEGIPEDQLPASRKIVDERKPNPTGRKSLPIDPMGNVSLVNGTGKQFSTKIYSHGTIEVWSDPNYKKPKLLWTSSPDPLFEIGDVQDFHYEDKRGEWTMLDHIDLVHMGNLIPLYGKNLQIFSYS